MTLANCLALFPAHICLLMVVDDNGLLVQAVVESRMWNLEYRDLIWNWSSPTSFCVILGKKPDLSVFFPTLEVPEELSYKRRVESEHLNPHPHLICFYVQSTFYPQTLSHLPIQLIVDRKYLGHWGCSALVQHVSHMHDVLGPISSTTKYIFRKKCISTGHVQIFFLSLFLNTMQFYNYLHVYCIRYHK